MKNRIFIGLFLAMTGITASLACNLASPGKADAQNKAPDNKQDKCCPAPKYNVLISSLDEGVHPLSLGVVQLDTLPPRGIEIALGSGPAQGLWYVSTSRWYPEKPMAPSFGPIDAEVFVVEHKLDEF